MKIAVIALGMIAALLLAAIMLDVFPWAMCIVSRIHIGRWRDTKEWKKSINSVGLKWLKKTPDVPLGDNTRWTVIDRIRGKYKSKKIQSWQEAALLLGAEKICGEESRKAQKEYIKDKIDLSSGKWKEKNLSADFAMVAYAILVCEQSDKTAIRPAMDETAQMLFELAEKNETIPYNAAIPEVRFVDTVGMTCPFLFAYAREYKCEKANELAKKQIEEYFENGIDAKTGLPFHCFNKRTGAPLGIVGWGRGCGWLAMALADSRQTVEEPAIREFLDFKIEMLARALLPYQLTNAGWSRQILGEEIGESSATAMIAYFMKIAFEVTGQEGYKASSQKSMEFLMTCTRRDGAVDYAQGDTKGIGFYSSRLSPMPAAQGFAMRLEV